MSPAGPGGRPRNAWESRGGYRNRRLLRLYTLTNLTKKEIRKVLKADDFNPSESDIQKRLQSLLPKDYAKEHRSFRPSGESNLKLRSSLLHSCRDGRVSKARRYGNTWKRAPLAASRPASTISDTSSRLPIGFRNYSQLGTLPGMADYLSPTSSQDNVKQFLEFDDMEASQTVWSSKELPPALPPPHSDPLHGLPRLSIPLPRPSSTLYAVSIDPFLPYRMDYTETNLLDPRSSVAFPSNTIYASGIGLSEIGSPESQITNSSRLMLDGSSVQPVPQFVIDNSFDASREASPKQVEQDPGPLGFAKGKGSTASVITFESLKIRLSTHRSSSVQHIHSVLRLSFPSSYRSSTSWRSSWISGKSLGRSIRSKGSLFERMTSGLYGELSEDEQEVWNDIIDEAQFFPSHDLMPAYSFLAPFKRLCCPPTDEGPSCSKCGFSKRHALASVGDRAWYTLDGDQNQTDIFENTPLHYSAASGVVSIYTFTHLIPDNIDIHAKNTSGETFLHVLDTRYFGIQGIGGSPAYLGLLKHLQGRRFSFTDRDCHGRTILHVLLKRSMLVDTNSIDPHDVRSIIQDLSDILAILQPDLNALDNQGHNVGDQLIAWGDKLPSTTKSLVHIHIEALVGLYRNPLNSNISFRQGLFSANWKAEVWLKRLESANLITWIDIHGDTPLITILKKWKDMSKEMELQAIVRQLLNLGVDVNMRDRNGYTALAIAAIRGSRPCIAELVISGAMPNSRDYRGNGIIAVAHSRMVQASKATRNDYYGRILSCVALLTDLGAKLEPTQYEEWLPSAFKGF